MNADWLFQFSSITANPPAEECNSLMTTSWRQNSQYPSTISWKENTTTWHIFWLAIPYPLFQLSGIKQHFWHEPFPNTAQSTSCLPTEEIHSSFSDQISICCHLLCLKLHPGCSILLLLFCRYYGNPWMDVICTIHYVIRNHFTCSQIQWSTFRLNILALGFSELSTDGGHLFRAMALLSDEWAGRQQLP